LRQNRVAEKLTTTVKSYISRDNNFGKFRLHARIFFQMFHSMILRYFVYCCLVLVDRIISYTRHIRAEGKRERKN